MTAIKRNDSAIGRFYEIDGQRFPSVTHILSVVSKPALINWAANEERKLVEETAADLQGEIGGVCLDRATYLAMLDGRVGKEKAHRRELAKAGKVGTDAHALAEWYLRQQLGLEVGLRPVADDAAEWAFMAFEDWAKSVDLKPLAVEQVVFSKRYAYAGTMDALALVNGQPTVVDLKTGKSVYPEAHLQVAAYQIALEEMGQAKADAACIVRLPKVETEPEFEVIPVAPAAELFPTFLALIEVWRWWHQGEVAYAERRKAQKDAA